VSMTKALFTILEYFDASDVQNLKVGYLFFQKSSQIIVVALHLFLFILSPMSLLMHHLFFPTGWDF
jgi:hypothetical protein